MSDKLIKLGTESTSEFQDNFDIIYDEYKNKAVEKGYSGNIKIKKERGKVSFYIDLDDEENNKKV